jgi:hypothetical protein
VQFTIGFLLLLTTMCALSTCAARLVFRSLDGRGVTAQEANAAFGETVSLVRVPENARNVDYHARFQGGEASFDISEAEFLTWSETHSWDVSEFSLDGKPLSLWDLPSFAQHLPEDGRRVWYYSNASYRGGWSVLYDRKRGRGYIGYSPR